MFLVPFLEYSLSREIYRLTHTIKSVDRENLSDNHVSASHFSPGGAEVPAYVCHNIGGSRGVAGATKTQTEDTLKPQNNPTE